MRDLDTVYTPETSAYSTIRLLICYRIPSGVLLAEFSVHCSKCSPCYRERREGKVE